MSATATDAERDAGSRAAAARLLIEARHAGTRLAGLPAHLRPETDADAYAVQALVSQGLGWAVAGWKAGLGPGGDTSSAPLYAPLLQPSPARRAAAGMHFFGIEGEIAFRLGRDLPKAAEPHSRGAVMDAIASAHAAIEILETRYDTLQGRSRGEMLADAFNNGGFVPGPPVADWRSLDLAALAVSLELDGRGIFAGKGTHPVGDPLAPVVWFANFLNQQGGALRQGDYVTTGTCTGLVRGHAGAHLRLRFEGLGEAELRFA